jgi:hypothetical protein
MSYIRIAIFKETKCVYCFSLIIWVYADELRYLIEKLFDYNCY